MARIPMIEKKENLAPEHHRIYDAIAQSRGEVRGPFAALLHSPEVAGRTAHLGAYVRFESGLDPKIIELAVLTAARELECQYEWAAHVASAAKAGVSQTTIRAIQQRKAPEGLSSDEAQIVRCVLELLRSHRLTETTFQPLLNRLGVRGVVELVATIGYYAMLACTLNAFEVLAASPPRDLKI